MAILLPEGGFLFINYYFIETKLIITSIIPIINSAKPKIRVTLTAFFIFIELIIFSTGNGRSIIVSPSINTEKDKSEKPAFGKKENIKSPTGIPKIHIIFIIEKTFENFSCSS